LAVRRGVRFISEEKLPTQGRIMKDETTLNDGTNIGARSSGRPISQIVQEILDHVTEIIRSEFRLARVEVRQDLRFVAKAFLLLAVAVVLSLYALGFVLLGVVYGLATHMSPSLSALVVGIGVGIIAAVFLQVGRKRIKQASLTPDRTIQSLEENVTWMKKQVR
jgi:uncharacterized membrane protein YqjE